MKKISLLILSAAVSGMAFTASAAIPEPEILAPEGLSMLWQLTATWGYEALTEGTMQSTLYLPDGTVKEFKGKIVDEDGADEGFDTPTDHDNAYQINLTSMGGINSENPGRYNWHIPAGCVYINGEPNPDVTLSYVIGDAPDLMSRAHVIYPEYEWSSFLAQVQVTWGENLKPADGELPVKLLVDGNEEESCKAVIQTVYQTDEQNGGQTIEAVDGVVVSFNLISADAVATYPKTVDIIFPEGVVENENGEVNPNQTFTFFLLPQEAAEVSPGYGADISSTPITLSWDGATVVPTQGNAVIRGIDRDYVLQWGEEVSLGTDDTTVIIDTQSLDLPIGDYELIIPEGFVMLTNTDETMAISAEVYCQYTVGAPVEPMDYAVITWGTPMFVQFLPPTVMLSWREPVTYDSETEVIRTLDVFLDGEKAGEASTWLMEMTEGNEQTGQTWTSTVLVVELEGVIDWGVYGKVSFTVPEGFVLSLDYAPNPEQTFTWTVLPGTSYSNAEAVEIDGVPYLALEWDGEILTPTYNEEAAVTAYINGADTELDWTISDDLTTLYINMEGVPEEDYMVMLPDAMLYVGGDHFNNPAAITPNLVTAVEAIDASETTFTVYSIQGVLLLDNATDLRGLVPGIYIVNGKKAIVK